MLQDLGDEYYSVSRTEDGYLVVADDKGIFYYANEKGEASKFKAKQKRTDAERNFLKSINRAKPFKAHLEKHWKRTADIRENAPAPWDPSEQIDKAPTQENASLTNLPSPSHCKGAIRFPVILIEGDGRTNMDSATIYAELNEIGYSRDSYLGSVKDYFMDQSSGLFEPSFDVFLVTESEPFVNFIGKEAQMMNRAITSMLKKYPSFDVTQYDSDGDNYVDAFAVLYAGDRVNSGDKHLGGFQTTLKKYNATVETNGKTFNTCFIIEQSKKNHIVQFIHEFSHTMGLKDHYCVRADGCKTDYSDSVYQAPGAHSWDVMATGMYNGSARKPPNYSAFERNFMGWLDYTMVEDGSPIKALPPLGTNNFAYYAGVSKNEWFVFENRQLVKWDSGLPYQGMLVWHIDYNSSSWIYDVLNDTSSHQRVDIIEAGDIRVLTHTGGYMSQGAKNQLRDDPFPGYLKITELSPVQAWSGETVLDGLFNIVEKDTNVCFALDKEIATDECEFTPPSSSSSEPESSSSEESSSSSAPESSSSEESSSSTVPESSSAESSSSTEPESSSSESPTIAWNESPHLHGIHVSQEGRQLNISTPEAGLKTVRVFDVQGHTLATVPFTGTSHQIYLGKIANGTPLIVRIESSKGIATLLTR